MFPSFVETRTSSVSQKSLNTLLALLYKLELRIEIHIHILHFFPLSLARLRQLHVFRFGMASSHHHPQGSSAASSHGSDLFSFMPLLGILILTVTSVFSVIRARHDVPTLAFIISMYVFLMLLFYCLHVYDTLPENSQQKEKMRVPIWFLATILNVLFAYRVSTMLPLSLDCLVWAMAGSTSVLGFYVFFIYKEDKSKSLAAAANTKTDNRVKSVDSEPFAATADKV